MFVIGAMADIIPQVPARIPLGIFSIVGSYDSNATVWSALSWPYQLHLRITTLAVGSQTVTRPNMLARAAPLLEDVIEDAMASPVIRCGAP
ncbi:hypothetical protein O0I10_012671 [Lichtheimia ornata]|uniref:Uncharacterized protein n=1 Tax=Lichtheimia ornata TaxID=688661 RepID=A0AAD7UT19_9FUNG|nr:uncharacterized protein O0I10_012671 [Lichtheimia ornata]KAJ8651761.1 hypothetical protein O0I10_012671 [Lichtheimia ornata]